MRLHRDRCARHGLRHRRAGAGTHIRVIATEIDTGEGPDGLCLAACLRDRWPSIHIIVTSGHRQVTADMMPLGVLCLDKSGSEEQVLTHVRRSAA